MEDGLDRRKGCSWGFGIRYRDDARDAIAAFVSGFENLDTLVILDFASHDG